MIIAKICLWLPAKENLLFELKIWTINSIFLYFRVFSKMTEEVRIWERSCLRDMWLLGVCSISPRNLAICHQYPVMEWWGRGDRGGKQSADRPSIHPATSQWKLLHDWQRKQLDAGHAIVHVIFIIFRADVEIDGERTCSWHLPHAAMHSSFFTILMIQVKTTRRVEMMAKTNVNNSWLRRSNRNKSVKPMKGCCYSSPQ